VTATVPSWRGTCGRRPSSGRLALLTFCGFFWGKFGHVDHVPVIFFFFQARLGKSTKPRTENNDVKKELTMVIGLFL